MALPVSSGHYLSAVHPGKPRGSIGRTLLALGASAILVVACGSPISSPGASRNPVNSSPGPSGQPVVAGPSGQPVAVGAPGSGSSEAAAPAVEFQSSGDQVNGWWWLRDAGGAQEASWGFPAIPAAGPINLSLDFLATDAVSGSAHVPARFWLSYGPMVKGVIAAASQKQPVLVNLPNTSGPDDPVGYSTTGSYAIARSDIPTQADGVWVRISRVGPDGTVLPAQIAAQAASVRLAGSAGAPESTPGPALAAPAATDFTVNGDEISGWWWLRDSAGAQRASWIFSGTPISDQIRLDFSLLATDTFNGGRDIDARFWLTYRVLRSDGSQGPLSEPVLMTLKNNSPFDDPVGYSTAGSYPLAAGLDTTDMNGLWVGISRGGPDGVVLSTHIAVRAASLQIDGLNGGPAVTPTPTPTGGLYGPLTITTQCQTWSAAPFSVTGSAAPDLHLEFAPTESFSNIFASDDYVLSAPAYTYESVYGTDAFPQGIWVRWAGDHSVKAFAANQGYCAGSTPPPTATPTPTPEATLGPPSGTSTIVSLGDSYISGEAGRWAGNSFDWYGTTDASGSGAYYDNASGTAEMIAGCHRSHSAEVHIDRGGYGTVTTINLACSGATTASSTSSGGDKPGVDLCPDDPNHDCPADMTGQATLLGDTARQHNVKLVVLSIGGNDFQFSDTVVQCSMDFIGSSYFYDTHYCHENSTVLARFSDSNVAAVKANLINSYTDILTAMRAAGYPDSYWSLLVQTYPSPLPPGGSIRYGQIGYARFTNGCPFWDADASWANNTALPTINAAIKSAAADFAAANPELKVRVLDISSALNGHRLCENTVNQVGITEPVEFWTDSGASDGSEWVAQIRGVFSVGGKIPLPGSVYYKNESFHPNYWGQLALRDCLRQAYNNGDIRGGTCTFMQNGLNSFKEPTMILSQP